MHPRHVMSFYMEFITAVSCYGANVGGVLLLKDAICKCVFGVIVVDRYSDLRDDRAALTKPNEICFVSNTFAVMRQTQNSIPRSESII